MRSVPSFLGEFKRREKSRSVSTVKQELPIEREANVRQQLKKQILQRLKKETLKDGAESRALDSEANARENLKTISTNADFDDVNKGLGTANWDADNLNVGVSSSALEKSPQGRRKDLHFSSVDSPDELQLTEEREDLVVRRKKSTGERAKTPLHEKQDVELYIPSFASRPPATAERRRKTEEIKQKAAERRRFIENERHTSSPDINILVNDRPVTRIGGHISTPNLGRRSGSTLTINIDDTETGGRRDTGMNNSFLAVSPRLTRASSFPSVYEAASTFGEDAHFKDFARKKQDKLEEDLRRVEDSLNQTFSGLKKYLKTN